VLETIGAVSRAANGTQLARGWVMFSTRFERERPGEWLRRLAEEPDSYELLLVHAGGLAQAAYRLASARCRLQGNGDTPTLRELQIAALNLAQRLGTLETLPITSLLANDCEAEGLRVIRPIPTPSSGRHSAPPLHAS
jgi:hypothetical protein